MTGNGRARRHAHALSPEPCLLWGLCCAWLLWASPGFAQVPARGLVAPTTLAPSRHQPGETLAFVVESATGLTPPPGVQEERAHRAFSARLCAHGLSLAAPERVCLALPVRNVRPLASHSLSYRVEASLPHWLAPGSYDLGVRFPGGTDEARAALRVGGVMETAEPRIELSSEGALVQAPKEAPATLRVHLGAGRMLSAPGAQVQRYPLPDERGELAGAVVAWVFVPAGSQVRLISKPAAQRDGLRLSKVVAQAGRPVWLEVQGAAPGAQAFWSLGPGESARGLRTSARFVGKRPLPISALVIEADGRATRLTGVVDLEMRRSGGCQVGHARSSAAQPAAGLLLLALSWKLGPGRRGRGVRNRSAARNSPGRS